MLTSGSSRGRGDQPGAGVPPLTGLQHWHHHHGPAGCPGQPLKHAAQCPPGTALVPLCLVPLHPALQAGGASPAPGRPWPKRSWDPALPAHSDLQPHLLGPQGPCGHFLGPLVWPCGALSLWQPFPASPQGPLFYFPTPCCWLHPFQASWPCGASSPSIPPPPGYRPPSHLNPTGLDLDAAACSLKAPPPLCWVLLRVPLPYHNSASRKPPTSPQLCALNAVLFILGGPLL